MTALGGARPMATEPTAHRAALVDWFVLLVMADGFLTVVLDIALGRNFPLEVVVRCLILLQIGLAILFYRGRRAVLPAFVVGALLLQAATMAIPPAMLLLGGADPLLVLRTLYFMFGIGFLTVFAPFVPFGLAGRAVFPVFFAVCMGFGAAQVITQDLMLPDAVKLAFGIQFEQFTNGQIRAVSFFASPPRFAEMLVFVSLCLFFDIVAGRRLVLLRVAVFGVALWLLYNTYSRSGYVLWAAAMVVAVVLARRQLLVARSLSGLFARVLCGTLMAMLLAGFALMVRPETLAIHDLTSMVARLNHWAVQGADLATADTLRLWLGTGDAPLFSRSETEYFTIDNLMLILLRYGGVLGLCGFLLAYVAVLVAALRSMRGGRDRLVAPLVAFYCGLLVESLFVDNHNTIYLAQFVLLVVIVSQRIGGGARQAD